MSENVTSEQVEQMDSLHGTAENANTARVETAEEIPELPGTQMLRGAEFVSYAADAVGVFASNVFSGPSFNVRICGVELADLLRRIGKNNWSVVFIRQGGCLFIEDIYFR